MRPRSPRPRLVPMDSHGSERKKHVHQSPVGEYSIGSARDALPCAAGYAARLPPVGNGRGETNGASRLSSYDQGQAPSVRSTRLK